MRAIYNALALLSTFLVGFWLLGRFGGSPSMHRSMMTIWKMGYGRAQPDRVIEVIVVALAVILVALLLGGNNRRTAAENRGEATVRRTLAHNFDSSAYHLLNSITLPFEDG